LNCLLVVRSKCRACSLDQIVIILFVISEANIFIVYREWAVNIQRDSYAAYVGHISAILAYFAIAENEHEQL
jgi:hypothetical protein